MTLIVASLLLPYTVHFEIDHDSNSKENGFVDNVSVPINASSRQNHMLKPQNNSLNPESGDLAETNPLRNAAGTVQGIPSIPGPSSSTSYNTRERSASLVSKDSVNSNPATNNLIPKSGGIDKPVSIIAQLSNKNQSTSSLPLANDSDSAGILTGATDPPSSSNIDSIDSVDNIRYNNPAQEFFYSNRNGISSGVPSIYLPEDAESFSGKLSGPLGSLNNSSYNLSNTVNSTFVQPRLVVNRTNSFSSSVSEKKSLRPSLEPTLSSLRVNRNTGKRWPLAEESANKQNISIDINSGSSRVPATVADNDAKTPTGEKVTPYGGFSKPCILDHHENNIFATAPWKIVPLNQGNGSLKNAVHLAKETGIIKDDIEWVGLLGMATDLVPTAAREKIFNELATNYNSDALFIPDELFDGHYNSFCKQILWPSFHYQIPDDPKSNAFEIHSWEDYKKVNQLFADRIVAKYKEGDVIWVHDYHLLLVPEMIRSKLPNAKIGFFLHISFPSSEVFRCFAQRRGILNGMLGADVVCFQTEEYVRHFFQTCNRLLLADFDENSITYKGRNIQVTHIPIGIDENTLMKRLNDENVLQWRQLIHEKWNDKILLVSRDKIDRIRGIKEKLLAYESFLIENPQYLDKTILILICLKGNREIDDDLEIEIWKIVGRINSMTANIAIDKPVVYLNQEIDFNQYLALLSESSAFIVSTLREGMNLTSHEFIISSNSKYSPLVLSEFTGSAQVITKGPLIINPYNIRESAQAIKTAIEMSLEEKKKRWEQMHATVSSHDSRSWVKNCLQSIETAWEDEKKFKNSVTQLLTQKSFNERYMNAISNDKNNKRLIILNIGNLAFSMRYRGATLNPVQQQFILSTITDLTRDPNNIVYIFSYMRRTDLIRRYRRVSNIGLIAENGGYIREPNSDNWISLVSDGKDLGWIEAVKSVMDAMVERLSGSYVEAEDSLLRFHTEKCVDIDEEHKNALVGELISHVNDLYSKDNIHATLVDKIVVVQESNLSLRSLTYVLNTLTQSEVNKLEGSIKIIKSPSLATFAESELEPVSSINDRLDSSDFTSNVTEGENKNTLSLVMYAGGSTPIDEEIFNFCNELNEKKIIDDVLSVKVGDLMNNSSAAREKLEGINELLQILSNAM